MRLFNGHMALFMHPEELRFGWFNFQRLGGLRIRIGSLVVWYKHLRNS